MAAQDVRISVPANLYGGRIEIEGLHVKGVRGFRMTGQAGNLILLTLDLIVHEAEIDGQAVVSVPEKTHAGLVALGWTPPDS